MSAFFDELDKRCAIGPGVRKILESPLHYDGTIGWCSSCDKVWQPEEYNSVGRPECPNCGDWLVFAKKETSETEAQS